MVMDVGLWQRLRHYNLGDFAKVLRELPGRIVELLRIPAPDAARLIDRIATLERDILLPIKVVAIGMLLHSFYFRQSWIVHRELGALEIAVQTTQYLLWLYIAMNAVVAGLLLSMRRVALPFVAWVVFAMSLVDGIFLSALVALTGGYDSILYWLFLGLIVRGAVSVPRATSQILLNLTLTACYVMAGVINIYVVRTLDEEERFNSANQPIPYPVVGSKLVIETPSQSEYTNSSTTLIDADYYLTNYTGTDGLTAKWDATAHKLRSPDGQHSAYLNILSNGVVIYYSGAPLTVSKKQRVLKSADNVAIIGSGYSLRAVRAAPGQGERGPIASPGTTGGLAAAASPLGRGLLKAGTPEESLRDNTGLYGPPDNLAQTLTLRLALLLLMTVCCYGLQVLLERQRQAVEEAGEFAMREGQLRSAGRVAAEFTHQIKNPLAIINNAAFSLQRALKQGKAVSAEQIRIIQEEVEHSDKIITQIMGYAQLSEGHVEKLNLIEELDHAIAQVFPPAAGYPVRIHSEYRTAEFPPMFMQRRHLLDSFVNLLQNAREALGDKGGNIFVSAQCHADYSIEVTICDDGPGVPADKQEKIFEAYFTTKQKGTGLGLATVKHNVELYGGTVRVESGLGKGARFTLVFPAKALMKLAKQS